MADVRQADNQIQGDIAHDAQDSSTSNPLKLGAEAIAHGTNPTAVAAADRTKLYANRAGVLFTIGGHPNTVVKEWTFTASQTDIALVTVSNGTKIVVTAVHVTCDNDNTDDISVRIGLAASTISATSTSGVTGVVLSHPGIPAGGGVAVGNGAGILAIGADGEDLRITCEAPSTAVRVVISYFTIES